MSFHDRNYMIFNVIEKNSINFSEVLETSSETLRLNSDETKSFVKYLGQTVPTSVSDLTTKEGPYTHTQFTTILSSNEWTNNSEV